MEMMSGRLFLASISLSPHWNGQPPTEAARTASNRYAATLAWDWTNGFTRFVYAVEGNVPLDGGDAGTFLGGLAFGRRLWPSCPRRIPFDAQTSHQSGRRMRIIAGYNFNAPPSTIFTNSFPATACGCPFSPLSSRAGIFRTFTDHLPNFCCDLDAALCERLLGNPKAAERVGRRRRAIPNGTVQRQERCDSRRHGGNSELACSSRTSSSSQKR